MTATRDQVLTALRAVSLPDGTDLAGSDMIRALSIDAGTVRFVIEAPSPEIARGMEPLRQAAEQVVSRLDGVDSVSAVLTAHGGGARTAPSSPPPDLKIGRHPTPQQGGPAAVEGIGTIIAVGSGKGGVGKSTVSANLAVALAKAGKRVALLDADIYGPSQPRMMGLSKRPASPDGKTIEPLVAHGVTVMSMGLMLKETEAVVWRGPMLMGALQQMMGQVAWGAQDVMIVDLPPGTGDVQLTLSQRFQVGGTIVVSTPQDVALLDARRALDMFNKLKTPVLGLIENMSTYICPSCGHEAHLFGHGAVEAEAGKLGVPFLGALPLELETRLAGDAGEPIALGESAAAAAYAAIARNLIERGAV